MALCSLTAAGVVALGLSAWPLASAAAATSPAAPSGGWRWPLAGTPVVSRPFQPPAHPWSAGHRGVDLAAPPDAAVLAAGSGLVSFAGYVAGVGVVAVAHPGGLRTTYEPVAPSVVAGRPVSAGDPIGRLLPGHGDCGPGRWCLHWGLLRGSVYLDPLTLVRRGPVRLLPLTGLPATARRAQPATAIAVDRPPATPTSAPEPARATRSVVVPTVANQGRRGVLPVVAGGAALTTWLGAVLARRLRGWLVHRRIGPAGVSPAGRRAWP
jgi:murein DD-endopeptidase MepM/ murein hydrolase activator NlpD